MVKCKMCSAGIIALQYPMFCLRNRIHYAVKYVSNFTLIHTLHTHTHSTNVQLYGNDFELSIRHINTILSLALKCASANRLLSTKSIWFLFYSWHLNSYKQLRVFSMCYFIKFYLWASPHYCICIWKIHIRCFCCCLCAWFHPFEHNTRTHLWNQRRGNSSFFLFECIIEYVVIV